MLRKIQAFLRAKGEKISREGISLDSVSNSDKVHFRDAIYRRLQMTFIAKAKVFSTQTILRGHSH